MYWRVGIPRRMRLLILNAAMRDSMHRKKLLDISLGPRSKWLLVAASFLLYWTALFLLYPAFGLPITTLGILPILIGAWAYGMWPGIFFTLGLYTIDTAIIVVMGWDTLAVAFLPSALLGLIISAVTSLIVGRLGETERRNQEEFQQHKLLLEERTASARFLNLLNDILLAAIETDDKSSMLRVLAIRTGELFKTDNCCITFWDENERLTIPMAAYGPASERTGMDARSLTPMLMDSGGAIAIDDTRTSTLLPENVRRGFSSRSVLGLPLISGERNLGALILAHTNPHTFSKEEIARGEMAARQISLAVTKALLLEEAQRSVHELAGLHDISQAFSLYGDVHRSYGMVAETVAGLMNAKVCAIGLYNPAAGELTAQTPAFGLEDKVLPPLRYPPEEGQGMWSFAESGIYRANSEADLPSQFLPVARTLGIESILAAPLWESGRHLLGVIFVANKPDGFSEADVRLLEVFSGQVTVVLQNIHLLSTERMLAEKLGVLYAIADATTQAANEDQLIEHVTYIIGERLYSDSFGILLLDDLANELYLHSSYRIGSHEGLNHVPLGVGIAGSVARSGKPLRVDDTSTSPEHLSIYPLTRSVLCVPLRVEEKLLGVVNAESDRMNAFTTADEELLTIIAGQLATAIQRLRIVQAEHFQTQQLERSNSLIRALAQVNTRAATAADLMGVLTTLGSELNKLGLRCAVALQDPSNHHVVLRYISLPPKLIKGMERIGKIKLEDFRIPVPKPADGEGAPPKSSLVQDPLTMIMSWIPDFPIPMARKVLKLIGVTETTSICDLPLITEGKLMGTLWMWGEGVHENDLPTVSLFANQVAAALQKANLITEVSRLAETDELTGISNRRRFFELAEKSFALAARVQHPLAALIVDLDHFKAFNDTYGHVVGDQVLRETARRMQSALRETDIIGRYGGEEFSILLPDTSTKSAVYVAERLISQVSEVFMDTDAGKLTIHISVGVTGMCKETPTLNSLIVRSDQAMYLAKRSGGNCVAVK
jgi:diguanylate cyclase (GGDEF)-like protein